MASLGLFLAGLTTAEAYSIIPESISQWIPTISASSIMKFNPVQQMNQILLSVVAVIALIFVYKYWNRVIFLLTGDDRLHCNSLDAVYFWCCRCAGCCDGEWTRNIACCCGYINLKKAFGRKCGVVSTPIEVANLVVGDLPFSGSSGDFYLTMECGDYPPINTSITESTAPKLVHFSDVITLRVRNSAMEAPVRFTVKELNVFGSDTICELNLSAHRAVAFSEKHNANGENLLRFQMDPSDRSADVPTPPWIAMEMRAPTEFRGRDNLFTIHTKNMDTGVFEPSTIKDFKKDHQLLTRRGAKVTSEPTDNDESIGTQKKARKAGSCFCGCFLFILLFSVAVFRIYLWRCWIQYEEISMAHLNGLTYQNNKNSEVNETELKNPTKYGLIMPTHDQVIEACDHYEPRPKVLAKYAAEYNINTPQCFKGACQYRDWFVANRPKWFGALCVLTLLSCWLMCKKTKLEKARDNPAEAAE